MSILTTEPNNHELRDALAYITTTYIGKRAGDQLHLIADLRQKHQHSISIVREAVPGQRETIRYNCIQHALDLVNPPAEIIKIANDHADVFPSPEFMQYLIRHVLVELAQRKDGCLIIYSDAQGVKHAGKIEGELVVSKWGLCHLWRHCVYEVPITYGDDVKFFESIAREASIQWFLKYAGEKLNHS